MIKEDSESKKVRNTAETIQLIAGSLESKRKASEDPTSPSANKRIKSSHSESPEPKKIPVAGNPIPFPEKVSSDYCFIPNADANQAAASSSQ